MEMATIEMPKAEAEARLSEYQQLAEGERTALDDRIKAGFRALARGLPVIKLADSVVHGGFFDSGLPRIAVVRADATECWVQREGRREFVYMSRDPGWWHQDQNRGALVNATSVRVTVPQSVAPEWTRQDKGHTLVPIIPPEHRPRRSRLRRFHILWEVERWDMTPPRDPALLKHIGGDLWAVMAAWDLTELERAVLAGRT
jgi:hypothetical protein